MTVDDIKRIEFLRAGARVERCHAIPHVGSYSVASHTFGMLALLMVLHPRPSLDLIRAITFHDASHESVLGDIPRTAKRFSAKIALAYSEAEMEIERRDGFWVDLGPEDQLWLAGLDTAEFLHWTEDQLLMGNRFVQPWRSECTEYAIKLVNEEKDSLHDNLLEYLLYLIRK